TDLLVDFLKKFLPVPESGSFWLSEAKKATEQGNIFELLVQEAICHALNGTGYKSDLWLEPTVGTDGKPLSNGYNCNGTKTGSSKKGPRPDYILSGVRPTAAQIDGPKKTWLIGDIKLSVKTLYNGYVLGQKKNQWKAIYEHAKNYEYLPVTVFVTWNAGEQFQYQALKKEALDRDVMMVILSLR